MMEKRPVAYQLYSAREEAQNNLPAVLHQLAAMGYDGVECAGLYGYSAREYRQLLDDTGLKAISCHVPFAEIEADMFGAISAYRQVGCKYIAVPYLDDAIRPGAAGFARAIATITRFGHLCRDADLTLLYHNHDFEFCKLSEQYGLDFLFDAIPCDILQTEIDVCWVKFAGLDPASYIRKYAGRCPVVHLKDYVDDGKGSTPYALLGDAKSGAQPAISTFEFRPFGYGCQDAKGVVEAAITSGAKWFVIEQDLSIERTPLEAAEMSIGTLQKIGCK